MVNHLLAYPSRIPRKGIRPRHHYDYTEGLNPPITAFVSTLSLSLQIILYKAKATPC